jgi:hypothetical protein
LQRIEELEKEWLEHKSMAEEEEEKVKGKDKKVGEGQDGDGSDKMSDDGTKSEESSE